MNKKTASNTTTDNSNKKHRQSQDNSQDIANTSEGDGRLIVAPCNNIELKAPIRWLTLAWQDIKAAPKVSMLWGAIIALASLIVAVLAFKLGKFALLAILLSGFTYIAPLLGVALYSVSRGLEMGKQPTFAYSVRFVKRLIPYASGFFLVQIVILLIWSRSGMIATAFIPTTEHEQSLFLEALKSGQLLFSGDGSAFLHFLLLGSVFGSIFATLTFIITAVSLPMLADKEVDKTIFALEAGKTTEVFEQDDRFEIFRVVAHDFATTAPFQQVQEQIKEKIQQQRLQEARRETLEDLREKATVITMYDEAEPATDK